MSTCRDERPDAHEVLPLDLLKDAAELRAAGHDWAEVGAALGRDRDHLRLACRRDPRFEAELEVARRGVLREAEAEMLRRLREHLRSEDERLSADAAERLAKYLTAQRNCDTRLKVEEVKKDAKVEAEQIKADAKGSKDNREEHRERDPVRAAVRTQRELRTLRREAAAPPSDPPTGEEGGQAERASPGAPEG